MVESVGNLSLIEKIGQMFMIGIDGTEVNARILELIQTYKVGGVILTEKNIVSAEQLLKLVNSLKAANMGNSIPLLVAIEQESGRANLLPEDIRKLPSIKFVADTADKLLIYNTANLTGKVLNGFGINMNFWPMLDLGGFRAGKPLEDRCISANTTLVASYGEQIINGLKDAQIIPVPKYFPGHGDTKENSQIVIPYTTKSIAKMETSDLIPFISAIDSGIESMMIGNINVAKLNIFAPATLSYKVVTKLLREKLGFKGISITDDLCTTSVDIQYGIKSSARRAVLAGNDILIIKDMSKVRGVLEDIEKQFKRANLDERVANDRIERIIGLKVKYNLKDEEKQELKIDELNDEIENLLTKINGE